MRPRILFADSHQILRAGVAHALAGRATIVAAATTPTELVGMVNDRSLEFDMLLMELELGGRRILRVMQGLLEVRPELRVLVMTSMEELAICQVVLRQGVSGFIGKSWAHLELPTAVTIVSSGGRYVSPSIVSQNLHGTSILPEGVSALEYLVGDDDESAPQKRPRQKPIAS